MYALSIRPALQKKLEKLAKKKPKIAEIIVKKTEEIVQNPQHYKNLRRPLQHGKRVHVDSHFVLTFSVDENLKTVILEDFDHHDNIYAH
ncbi:MAG TPA: type II toxin-antitoxin system RelE/ParE family toxin [Candidatus Nanoarchaeia archaeon]|nr:type II toxin-antitoxin system RelE/ParE family toxin [Candidatus Nanoarchaeia archaeon]